MSRVYFVFVIAFVFPPRRQRARRCAQSLYILFSRSHICLIHGIQSHAHHHHSPHHNPTLPYLYVVSARAATHARPAVAHSLGESMSNDGSSAGLDSSSVCPTMRSRRARIAVAIAGVTAPSSNSARAIGGVASPTAAGAGLDAVGGAAAAPANGECSTAAAAAAAGTSVVAAVTGAAGAGTTAAAAVTAGTATGAAAAGSASVGAATMALAAGVGGGASAQKQATWLCYRCGHHQLGSAWVDGSLLL